MMVVVTVIMVVCCYDGNANGGYMGPEGRQRGCCNPLFLLSPFPPANWVVY